MQLSTHLSAAVPTTAERDWLLPNVSFCVYALSMITQWTHLSYLCLLNYYKCWTWFWRSCIGKVFSSFSLYSSLCLHVFHTSTDGKQRSQTTANWPICK